MSSDEKPAEKRRVILILIILGIGIAVLAALFSSRPKDLPDQIVWLTPTEFTQLKRIGPLTNLKYTLMNWTAPLWKSYWRNRPQISINVSVFALAPGMSWPTNAPAPFVTATNGTRVWILSPMQLKSIETELTALPETAVLGRPRIITAEDVAARLSSGNSFGNGSNATFAGLSVFVMPSTANNKVILPLDFICTQFETNPISQAVSVKTNQAYTCRAVFPNNGGLLVENPSPEPGTSNRHWLFLSAKAVDASGRLIGR